MAAGPGEAGVSEGTAQRRTGLAQGPGVQRARLGVLCPVAVPGHRQPPQRTANGTGPGAPWRTEPAPAPLSQVLTRSRASIISATFVTTHAITI